jgi:hypothetical protein
MRPLSPAIAKTIQGFSFLLSGGCDEFQGGGWAWVALTCDFTIVALNSFALVAGASLILADQDGGHAGGAGPSLGRNRFRLNRDFARSVCSLA